MKDLHATIKNMACFSNEEFCDRLRKKFNLPDYIRLVTYVDVGYGDQTPHPPLRQSVDEAVLGRF